MKKFAFCLPLVLIAGCVTLPQQQKVSVQFIGKDTYTLPKAQQATVTLYAVERFMQDKSATIIQQKNIEISKVPFTVDFVIPANHKNLIQPPVNSNAEINYYVALKTDSKQSTEKNKIAIDFDKKFPYVILNGGIQQVYLR